MVQRLEWENIALGQLKMALHLFPLISRFRIVFVCVILKLVTGKVGTQNTQLLGNTLTGSTAAKGVGVLIEGLATSKNPLMTLKPNDTNSVYIDYETEDDTSDGVYPNQGNGTSQPLHFQATLKQDGNIAIEPGEFKATSTFQVTYP